jgi:hypothetical protein
MWIVRMSRSPSRLLSYRIGGDQAQLSVNLAPYRNSSHDCVSDLAPTPLSVVWIEFNDKRRACSRPQPVPPGRS